MVMIFLNGRNFAGSCILYLVGFILFFMTIRPVSAEDAAAIHQTFVKEIGVYQEMQQAEDQWAIHKDELVAQYKKLESQLEQLEKQNTDLAMKLTACGERTTEARRTIVETGRVKTHMQGTLESIVSRLETFISTDLPFLSTERLLRVEEMKSMLSRPDVVLAEKCRRALEALQVETEYGRSFHVSEESITMADRILAVDVLRAGRLSLFCRTPDGAKIGWFNRATGKWQPLPAGYKRNIAQAFDMALHRCPLEIIRLPLGRIEVP